MSPTLGASVGAPEQECAGALSEVGAARALWFLPGEGSRRPVSVLTSPALTEMTKPLLLNVRTR